MRTTDYFNLSMDEIVFEERNKNYGAYALREQYGHSILKAILITVSVFILSLFISVLLNKIDVLMLALANACKEETVINPTPVDITQPEVPVPNRPPGAADPGPKLPRTFVVALDGPTDATDSTAPSQTPDGPEGANPLGGTGGGGNVQGGMPQRDSVIAQPEEQGRTFTVVEQMPEFKGGNVTTWIEGHIEAPNDEGGTVRVHFVVDENGSVTEVSIVESSGDEDLDNEAVRVISKLSKPGFIPGRQRGKAVRVEYEIPISFSLDE